MTEIDLSKGLMAYWTMDDADVDNQRSLVRDRSGRGNHLYLSGGVTTSVEVPNKGNALSFDGTDDAGDAKKTLDPDGPQTLAVLLKPNANGTGFQSIAHFWKNGGSQMSWDNNNDVFKWSFKDGSNNDVSVSAPHVVGEWVLLVYNYTGEQIYLALNGEVKDNDTVTSHSTCEGALKISDNGFSPGTQQINADMGYIARWERSLSWQEVQALNRMTGRKVVRI